MPDALDNLLSRTGVQPSPGTGAGGGGGIAASQGHAPDNLDNLLALANSPQGATQPQAPAAPPPKAPTKPEGALGSLMSGIGDTATSGLLDEGSDLLETLGVTAGTDAKSVWSSGKGFSDTLSDNIAYERAQAKADRDAHPYAYIGGQVGGAFLLPASGGSKGALQIARQGALQGAAYGAGSGDSLEDRVGQAAEGAVLGAATATVLHPLLAGIGALGRKILGKGAVDAAEAAAADAQAQAPAAPAGTPPPDEGLSVHVTDDGTGHDPTDATKAPTSPPLPVGRSVDRQSLFDAAFSNRDGQGEAPNVPTSPPDATAWTEPDAQGNRQPVTTVDPLAPTPDGDETIPLHSDGGPDQAPTGEPVGSISRAGLQDLQAQVEHFRNAVVDGDGRAVDITPDSPEHPTLGAFRLGNLGDGPEPMSLLGALTRQLQGLPKLTDQEFAKQVQSAAGDLAGGDHEALAGLASQIAGPGGRPDLAIGVLRTVQRKAAESLDLFHGAGIDWSTASDDLVQQAGQSIYNLQKINELVQSAKVGAGRALRVFSLPNSEDYFAALAKGESLGTPLEDPVRSMPPLPSTREELANHFELWGMLKGNPEAQSNILQGTLSIPTAGKYLQSSFANLFTANILSATKTAMLNVVGPTLVNVYRALEKSSGAAVLAIDPTISATERAQYAATAQNSGPALLQTLGDIGDVFRYGVQAFKDNAPVLGGGGSVNDASITFGPYNSNLLKAAGADPDWKYTLGNVLNLWPKAFARVNAGLDEMAKRFTYLGETRLRAMVDAAGQGLNAADTHAFVQNALTSSMDQAGHATNEALLASAERTTFTGPVGSDGNFARWASTKVQTLRSDYPLTRFILPVFTVPANALGETLKRIPGINLLPGMTTHAADLAGDNGVVAQAEAHGRSLLGASFLTAGYLMNQAGVLTGAGPQNPSDARVWLQTHQPYSIRVGDTWVSYRKMDILGGLLSIPATLSDASIYHQMDTGADVGGILGMSGVTTAAVGSLATWFKDQASMRTATQLLTLGDNPLADPGKAVESLFGQIAAGLVSPALVRTMGVDAQDPYTRMKRGWEDYVKASIPGMSQQMEPLRNVLGEPINRPNNTMGEAIFPVTLAPVATFQKEPVLDELSQLYRRTGYAASADPHSTLGGFVDPRDVKLEDGVSLYSHLTQPRATMQLDGQTLKQALGDLFQSPEYNDAVDGDAHSARDENGDGSRAYMVSQVFNHYNRAIKAEVAAAYPKANAYMTAAAAKMRNAEALRTTPLQDLVDNPRLYQSNGIDPTQYSDKITEGAAGDLLAAVQGGGQ